MNHAVKVIQNLDIAIRDLKPLVKNPRLLDTGKEIHSIGYRPRELLTLILIAALQNTFDIVGKKMRISTDPEGLDGILTDADIKNPLKSGSNKNFAVEQVYVSSVDKGDIATLIVERILKKEAVGKEYASKRNLIVFVNQVGNIEKTIIAKSLSKFQNFDSYWLIYLESSYGSKYKYIVIILKSKFEPKYIFGVLVDYETGEYTCERQGELKTTMNEL